MVFDNYPMLQVILSAGVTLLALCGYVSNKYDPEFI